MKKYMAILGLLVVLNSTLFGQEKRIKLEIIDCISTETNISFSLAIKNISNQPIVTYIPKQDDICYGLIKITIVDMQNDKVHEFYPCTFNAADLDCITLDCHNTLFLKPNETSIQKFKLHKKHIYSHLKRGKSYKLFVEWYLKGVCFKTNLKNLLQEDVSSNKIDFRNK
ncbi:MAG: hypothetical protein GX416_10260 [Bacteroidales bacterium]|nr:hypothetical protein [Bacteroidales bacterium]